MEYYLAIKIKERIQAPTKMKTENILSERSQYQKTTLLYNFIYMKGCGWVNPQSEIGLGMPKAEKGTWGGLGRKGSDY